MIPPISIQPGFAGASQEREATPWGENAQSGGQDRNCTSWPLGQSRVRERPENLDIRAEAPSEMGGLWGRAGASWQVPRALACSSVDKSPSSGGQGGSISWAKRARPRPRLGDHHWTRVHGETVDTASSGEGPALWAWLAPPTQGGPRSTLVGSFPPDTRSGPDWEGGILMLGWGKARGMQVPVFPLHR